MIMSKRSKNLVKEILGLLLLFFCMYIQKLGVFFREVYLGDLVIPATSQIVPVAIKILKGRLGKKDRSTFVKEATCMRRLKHDNIVRLLGVASQKEPVMIILELASGGNLKSHVRDAPDIKPDQLLRYVYNKSPRIYLDLSFSHPLIPFPGDATMIELHFSGKAWCLTLKFFRYTREAAQGMDYIADNNIIHRGEETDDGIDKI